MPRFVFVLMYLCPDGRVLADREADEVPSLKQERRPVPPRRRGRVGRALGLPHRARLSLNSELRALSFLSLTPLKPETGKEEAVSVAGEAFSAVAEVEVGPLLQAAALVYDDIMLRRIHLNISLYHRSQRFIERQ